MTLAPSAKARILVVDDELTTRSAVARALSLAGYEACMADSGNQALSELASLAYDLMVLDLRMPGMDGMEVLARARRSLPDLQVIVLTAYATQTSAGEVMRAGAAALLLKPCSFEDIEAAISAALRRRPALSERLVPHENCVP